MPKKTITEMDRHALVGVFTVIKLYRDRVTDLERIAAEIVGAEDEGRGHYGHVSDFTWTDAGTIDDLLHKLDIKVEG